jgi:hypothetical protein
VGHALPPQLLPRQRPEYTMRALEFTCKRSEEDYNPLRPQKYAFITLISFYLCLLLIWILIILFLPPLPIYPSSTIFMPYLFFVIIFWTITILKWHKNTENGRKSFFNFHGLRPLDVNIQNWSTFYIVIPSDIWPLTYTRQRNTPREGIFNDGSRRFRRNMVFTRPYGVTSQN